MNDRVILGFLGEVQNMETEFSDNDLELLANMKEYDDKDSKNEIIEFTDLDHDSDPGTDRKSHGPPSKRGRGRGRGRAKKI